MSYSSEALSLLKTSIKNEILEELNAPNTQVLALASITSRLTKIVLQRIEGDARVDEAVAELKSIRRELQENFNIEAIPPSANLNLIDELNEKFIGNINNITSNLENLELHLTSGYQKQQQSLAESLKQPARKKLCAPVIYELQSSESIRDILTEYFVGLNGGPAVIELEKQYGTKWRGGSLHYVLKRFCRRKRLYEVCEAALASKKYTLDEVIEILERLLKFVRSGDCEDVSKSVHWLLTHLPEELVQIKLEDCAT